MIGLKQRETIKNSQTWPNSTVDMPPAKEWLIFSHRFGGKGSIGRNIVHFMNLMKANSL